MRIFILFSIAAVVLLNPLSAFTDSRFSVEVNQEKIILNSGEVTFAISRDGKEQCFKINNNIGIIPYYRYMGKGKYVYLKGSSLKETELIVDEKDKKKVRLIFQKEANFQLELDLSIKKGLPALFVISSLKNISSEPQNNIGYEWFSNYNFKEYIAQDFHKYQMPERVDTDYTCGMPCKIRWRTIGTKRGEKWVYLLFRDDTQKGLGIISKKPTSFGIREDRLVYWGEERGAIEEEESLSYEFVLIYGKNADDFKRILDKVSNGLE